MIAWNPHTERPDVPGEFAVIAVLGGHGSYFLLPELYVWCEAHECWMSVATAMRIKHTEFRWARETDFLETLP